MKAVRLVVIGVFALTCGVRAQDAASSGSSAAGVAATLAAPRVDTSIRTALSADGKSIRYGLDREIRNPPGHPLSSGQVFVASHDVKITFYKLNPLALDVSADVSDAPDPSQSIISNLIKAIAAIPGIVAPPEASGGRKLVEESSGCKEEDAARDLVQKLDRALYGEITSAKTLEAELEAWRDAINSGFSNGGVSAITSGIAAIKKYQDRLDPVVTEAKKQLALADKFAADTPGTDCEKKAATIYQLVQLISPHAKLEQIRKLQKAVADLQTTLRTVYAVDQKWINHSLEFVVKEDIVPTQDAMRLVVLKASPVSYVASDAAIEVKRADTVTATFVVKKYSRYVPEVGVGATATYFERPKYVTTTDPDGKMVVVRAQNDKVNLDPTVLVNFLPQGEEGPAVRMWQIGASSSKESPAVFIGAGWRLFGSGTGGVAIGVGAAIGWVKTLQGLDEGAVIKGTKDIDDHLKFDLNPRVRPYFNLQYKF